MVWTASARYSLVLFFFLLYTSIWYVFTPPPSTHNMYVSLHPFMSTFSPIFFIEISFVLLVILFFVCLEFQIIRFVITPIFFMQFPLFYPPPPIFYQNSKRHRFLLKISLHFGIRLAFHRPSRFACWWRSDICWIVFCCNHGSISLAFV